MNFWIKKKILKQIGIDYMLVILAVLIGIGSGFMAAVFKILVENISALATVSSIEGIRRIIFTLLIPATGGLLVGFLVQFVAKEAAGGGIPQIMSSLYKQNGIIRPRVIWVKTLASALTIGTGGSGGRVGPVAQIGAAIGSSLGQLLNLTSNRIRLLVACGAGSAIAATFNAPIAGSIFALEIILGQFTAGAFSLVIISSVAATTVTHHLFEGIEPIFLANYQIISNWELLAYLGLGISAAIVSHYYIYSLDFVEEKFNKLTVPGYIKPAIGGLGVGIIALFLPDVLGRGEDVVRSFIAGEITSLWFLLALIIFKIIATSLTIGSGGSGGVFFPGLFIGAGLGAMWGNLMNSLFPSMVAEPGAYALVGVAAVIAAMAQAPLMAVVMLFEITLDYSIILPVMLASGLSSLLAARLDGETIYSLKLAKQGIKLRRGIDENILNNIRATDVMNRNIDVILETKTIGDVVRLMQETKHSGFPVVNKDDELRGIITLNDIRRVNVDDRMGKPIVEVMTKGVITAHESESLASIVDKMEKHDVGRIPVIDCQKNALIGIITRSDLIKAYKKTPSL